MNTNTLARLLEYPDAEFARGMAQCVRELRGVHAEAAGLLEGAQFQFAALTSDQIEEIYTHTFDITPSCVAYVSIHLFGEENFKRGEFMATLKDRYTQLGFDDRGELPDHLSVLLRFAAIVDEDERRELYGFCLLSPLRKMIKSLEPSNPYTPVLRAIETALQAEFPDLEAAPLPVEQMRQSGVLNCSGFTPLACNCGTGHTGATAPAVVPSISEAPASRRSHGEAGISPEYRTGAGAPARAPVKSHD